MDRINAAMDFLGTNENINVWVDGLNNDFCTQNDNFDPETCQELVKFFIPPSFPVLAAEQREWVDTFCVSWGTQEGEEEIQGESKKRIP